MTQLRFQITTAMAAVATRLFKPCRAWKARVYHCGRLPCLEPSLASGRCPVALCKWRRAWKMLGSLDVLEAMVDVYEATELSEPLLDSLVFGLACRCI